MNFEQARFNMVEQQIRPWEVLDQCVLDLLMSMPREDFVPAPFRKLAFCDTCIPLGHGEVMMPPKVEARLLQALEIQATDKILEIGTGSGYLTALLAKLGKHVSSIEIQAEFTRAAEIKLAKHTIANVKLETGDGVYGWEREAPYDVIAVTSSVLLLSDHFQRQLTVGGRLFVIVGESPVMDARLITRVNKYEWTEESLFETDLPALRGAPCPQRFVF
jgi:protein-L-isoaspartate(D-aspartate) O-methyltransferase